MFSHTQAYRDFFSYIRWADEAQLAAAQTLGDEAYFRKHGFSFGTVHGLLLHMMSAQEVWRRRFEGEPATWMGDHPELQTDRAALVEAWKGVHERFDKFLAAQTDESLARVVNFKNLKGEPYSAPLWRLLTHACNHSTIHRAQLNSMLKLSGLAQTPMVDYSSWYFATQK
jgi:uncharacterized damage-inducible protein DinB